MTENTFVNSAGKTFQLLGLSPLEAEKIRTSMEAEWNRTGKLLPLPTYTAENAAGETITLPHDESTLQTDEERAAFRAYQDAQAAFEYEASKRIMQACFLCVEIDPDADKLWVSRQRLLGMAAPDDPAEKLLQYVQTEVIRSAADLTQLMTKVMLLGGLVNEEAAKAAESLFQRQLEAATLAGSANG